LSAEDKKKLHSFDLRVAIRKGFALAKMNRVGDAITEYERALRMDPNNAEVKRDLDKLRKSR